MARACDVSLLIYACSVTPEHAADRLITPPFHTGYTRLYLRLYLMLQVTLSARGCRELTAPAHPYACTVALALGRYRPIPPISIILPRLCPCRLHPVIPPALPGASFGCRGWRLGAPGQGHPRSKHDHPRLSEHHIHSRGGYKLAAKPCASAKRNTYAHLRTAPRPDTGLLASRLRLNCAPLLRPTL